MYKYNQQYHEVNSWLLCSLHLFITGQELNPGVSEIGQGLQKEWHVKNDRETANKKSKNRRELIIDSVKIRMVHGKEMEHVMQASLLTLDS